ncbi:aldehyde dehydrogenase family 3 member A2-like isoform X3 [Girardinichthys multiradiatus]|uniref:aldehyde dehydrogenase family 3 member A2-like isoform X3 n=1 Tax=Girardinichthys multiradiatus TaxID=208333 RepID=UPI001FAC7B5B|nr:aldehyde dehydrogenase family 3 member A2-like isoform X3 [Girardinichthys multiradiatus]
MTMSREQLAVQRARRSFQTGRTRPLDFRIQQLRRLQSFIKERQRNIKDALQTDLGKSERASELYEILVVEAELHLSITRLAEWAAPRPVEKNLFTLLDEVYVKPEPLGVVLIIGPWNYPWSLTLLPLVGAIAAGNAAILKPSEISSNSSKVIEEFLPLYLDQEFYADSTKTSDDYGRIINQRQFKRIMGLMEGCTIAFGGDADEAQGYIGPTVLKNVTGESKVMQEEIFGPLLPIITVNSVDEAIHFINEREKPLVLYVFSNDNKLIKKVIAETSSGALVANDCVVHFLDSALPFGGVGHSGMGRYRGRHTFDQLSNLRSCMIKQLRMEGLNSMRYPPHTAKKLSWARRFVLSRLNVQRLRNMVMFAMLASLAAFVVQVPALKRIS